MNKLQVSVISILLATGVVQTTNAAVASIAVIAGSYGVGLKYALLGLGWVYAGKAFEPSSHKLGMIGVITGAILLNDDATRIKFNTINFEGAKKANLTVSEMIAYNAELNEINLIFQEVVSELEENPSHEAATSIWSDYQEALSIDAFSALNKIISQK